MPGLFVHEWIAELVLKKISKRDYISKPQNVADYFFGAIAPDIRYVANVNRDFTHKPRGQKSIFEALSRSSISMPFLAGYETHLIADMVWSNETFYGEKSLSESVYEHYRVDVNNDIQKYALYLLVDDYFQGEAGLGFQFSVSSNVFRAQDISVLEKDFGFSPVDILKFKSLASLYLREPGIDTFLQFNFAPRNLDEFVVKNLADQLTDLSYFLIKFKTVAVDKCVASLEKYL